MNALPQTESLFCDTIAIEGKISSQCCVSKVLCSAHMSHIIINLIHDALWWLSVIMLALVAGVLGFYFGHFCHSFRTTCSLGLCLKCAQFWGLWDTCRFFCVCVFVRWSFNCCRVCQRNFSISCGAAECLWVWGHPSICAVCGLPIHLTNCHSSCLLSVQLWPSFWLGWTHPHFSIQLFAPDWRCFCD